MTNANEHISSVQSRIDELEHTISQRGEQIRNRAKSFRNDLQEELSPEEIINNYPLQAAGVSFVGGLLIGRLIKGLSGKRRKSTAKREREAKSSSASTALKAALGTVGVQALYMGRDYAISWLKEFMSRKNDEIKQKPEMSQRSTSCR